MKSFTFPVVALKFHDYKDRLEELYDTALGENMYITVERDNQYQRNSIPVYYKCSLVGYVANGEDRRIAYQVITQSGKRTVKGLITEVNRDRKVIMFSVKTDLEIDIERKEEIGEFECWSYDGKILPVSEYISRLRSILDSLFEIVYNREEWDESFQSMIRYVENNLWRDISIETEQLMNKLCKEIFLSKDKEWQKAGIRLSRLIGRQGTEVMMKLRMQELDDMSLSHEMDILLKYYGDDVKSVIKNIPRGFEVLFEEDRPLAVAKLWYARLNEHQAQAIKTLLAMKIRLTYTAPTEDELEQMVLNYAMRVKAKWKGRGEDGREVWIELIHSGYKVEYKGKKVGLFEKKNRKMDFDRVSCQKIVGIMSDSELYEGSYSELGQMLEPEEGNNGKCVRTIRNGNYQDNIFNNIADNMAKTLEKWKL